MERVSLADIVSLAQNSLEKPEPHLWLRHQLADKEPVNSIAGGALNYLQENQFDPLQLLTLLQQNKVVHPIIDPQYSEPFRVKGWGRRTVLGIGIVALLLVVFIYLRFNQG